MASKKSSLLESKNIKNPAKSPKLKDNIPPKPKENPTLKPNLTLKQNLARSFLAASSTYSQNALIQDKMQSTLLELLKTHLPLYCENVLELGCGSGMLTKKALGILKYKIYRALDIVDFSDYFRESEVEFICADMEDFSLLKTLFSCQKNHLILSNAALQWGNQKEILEFLPYITYQGGVLALGVFGLENLKEIRLLCGCGLDYLTLEEYQKILAPQWEILTLFERQEKLHFNAPLEAFWHLKQSGVNALKPNFKITKQILSALQKDFNNTLTYNPLYILAQKK